MDMPNKTRKSELSGRIRIVDNSQETGGISKKHLHFYMKYASIVAKTLKKPLFQRFVKWVTKRESIERANHYVQVMVLPFRKENGKPLAGRWSSKGRILIYPKTLNFIRKMMRNYEKETVYLYLKGRAMATLIHELLHAKYLNDEDKVRELTMKYFRIFFKRDAAKNLNVKGVLKMLFPNCKASNEFLPSTSTRFLE